MSDFIKTVKTPVVVSVIGVLLFVQFALLSAVLDSFTTIIIAGVAYLAGRSDR